MKTFLFFFIFLFLGLGSSLACTYVVRPDGLGDFPTIQAAIDAAVDGDVICLTDGIFTGNGNRDLDPLGKEILIRSQNGDPSNCIIDAEDPEGGSHGGIFFHSDEDTTTIVEGLTFTNCGSGVRVGNYSADEFAKGKIKNCLIRNSTNAISLSPFSELVVVDSRFLDNETAMRSSGPVQARNCFFEGHSDFVIDANGGPSSFYNCQFWNNHHGLIWADTNSAWFFNCLFSGNGESLFPGGLFIADEGGLTLQNCSIVNNTSLNEGIFFPFGGSMGLVDCIVAYNNGVVFTEASPGWGSIDLDCTDIYGNTGGDWIPVIADQFWEDHNFSLDPEFCDLQADHFGIFASSPCAPDNNPCGLIGAIGVQCISYPSAVNDELSTRAVLHGNYPNPFNPRTSIEFELPRGAVVNLAVFDIRGRLVRRLLSGVPYQAGRHVVPWTGIDDGQRSLPSGTYFCRLEAGGYVELNEMTLVR